MSTEDTIAEFAPELRTDSQAKAFRMALQILGASLASTSTTST
jgi:hypothetical protein